MLQRKSVEIPVDLIRTNPEQPRKNFSASELEELTRSIKEYGVLQPIILNKERDGKYIIIAGERRFRAAKYAGLNKIPAVVKEFSNKDSAIISIIENVQREDLSFIEEAKAYKKLMDEFGLTQSELSYKIGKKQSTISNKIRILSLPEEIQDKIVDNRLTERHARALLRIDDQRIRSKVLEKIINNDLNVKQSEKLIEEIIKTQNEKKKNANRVARISYKIYMNSIRGVFKQIKEVEKNASLSENDVGDYVEVKILIPKNGGCFT